MAAGHGTRMRSHVPKVLHRVCGKPMVEWVIDAARDAGAESRRVRGQARRRRRGGAAGGGRGRRAAARVRAPAPPCSPLAGRSTSGPIVILSGDHPLVTADQIADLLDQHRSRAGHRDSAHHRGAADPAGYGRIVRDGERRRRAHRRDQGRRRRAAGGARHPRGQPRHLRLRGADASSRALEQVSDENGELYLTGVFPILTANGSRDRHLQDRRPRHRPRRQRPRRPDGGRAARPAAHPRGPRACAASPSCTRAPRASRRA